MVNMLGQALPNRANTQVAGKMPINNKKQNLPSKAQLEQYLHNNAPKLIFANKAQVKAYIAHISKMHNIKPETLERIVAIESQYCKFRFNKRTLDHGCAQINVRTAQAYKWNVDSIRQNDAVNLYAAAILLKDLKKAKKRKMGPKWVCTYNIGFQDLPKTCDKYYSKFIAANID